MRIGARNYSGSLNRITEFSRSTCLLGFAGVFNIGGLSGVGVVALLVCMNKREYVRVTAQATQDLGHCLMNESRPSSTKRTWLLERTHSFAQGGASACNVWHAYAFVCGEPVG